MSAVLIFDAKLKEERNYWLNRLAGVTAGATTLEPDRDTAEVLISHGNAPVSPVDAGARRHRGHYKYCFDHALSANIRRLTGSSPFLLYTLLVSGLKVCYSRYTSAAEVAVGSPPLAEYSQANTLVIMDEVRDGESFRELLLRVRQTLLDAYAHQRYPYHRLLKDLGVINDEAGLNGRAKGAVLFDVAAELEGFHGRLAETGEGLRLRFKVEPSEPAPRENAGGSNTLLSVVVEYDEQRYSLPLIIRFIAHCEEILRKAVADAGQRVGEIEMLSAVERQLLLIEWSQTEKEYPQTACIHQLFEAQVERSPEAIALEFENEQISYHELNARSNQMAHYLRQEGIGPESRVGFLMLRSTEMIVALLGVLKAGGAYLPLDPACPRERLRFLLEDAATGVLLTQERLLDVTLESQAKVMCVDNDWPVIAEQCADNLSSITEAGNLAYVIYTSGSAGQPKGVMVSHQGVVNYLHWSAQAYRIHEGSGSAVHSPLSFDLTVTSLWTPLLAGSRIVLLPEEDGIKGLAEILDEGREFSLIKLTPSHLEVLGQSIRPERAAQQTRAFVVGGEALHGKTLELWREQAPELRVINEYGPTEAVVGCCVYEVAARAVKEGYIPIGRPISNTELYILDQRLEPVGIGVRGELYIGGAGVARGYLGRGDLTGERFIPHPFSREGGVRLYRTGDLARYLPGGEIEYLGRRDQQVKIRGYRVELGEIEAALTQYEQVREVTVIVRGEERDKRLVAYVVMKDEEESRVSELREYLKEKLPDYMAPWAYVRLERLPLTANGKVDKKALPQPEMAGGELDESYQEPRTEVEGVMAGIWRQVLGVERVGAEGNFFEIGGHSLLATRVVSRIREVFKVELPLRTIFEEKTLAGLSRRVEAELRAGAGLQTPPIERAPRGESLPLSFAQQRLWFIDQLEPGGAMYNIPSALRVRGELRRESLESALGEVVRRHEVLRTRFEIRGGQPVQIIDRAGPVAASVIDVSWLEERQREKEARRIAGEEAARGFDLGRGPLLRAGILRLGEQDQALLFTMHHIVSDEWSSGVLTNEVSRLYEAYGRGEASPLEELPIQYADYAVWQREWLRGEALDRQVSYWREHLDGVEALELPTDYRRPVTQSYEGADEVVLIPAETLDRLRELGRREGVTMFMLLMSAFKILLHRYGGQEQIVVGTPIAGRNQLELEPLIGFFINMLAIKTDLAGEPSVREAIGREREASLGAYAHQDVPFEKIVEELQPERDLSRHPIFQVTFVYEKATEERAAAENLRLSEFGTGFTQAKYDLALAAVEEARGLTAAVRYCRALFDGIRARRMLWHLRMLLEGMTEDADRKIGQIEILSESEKAQILSEWNDTQVACPGEKRVHDLFEEQAERTPDAIAVVYEGEQVSYRALNRKANQLGHYLKAMGIGPEVLVGVCLERSIEMVVGLIGVWKAGAVYVAMDPSYPKQRLRWMIEDAAASVALTSGAAREALGADQVRVIDLEDEWGEVEKCGEWNPSGGVNGDNLAYVIYTSGSTGNPKGAMLTHAGIVNCIYWMQATYQLNEKDKFLMRTSLNFDPSVWELFWPLWLGGAVILADQQRNLEIAYLIQLIHECEVTSAYFIPSMLRAFLYEYRPGTCWSLKRVICGGESIPIETVNHFFDKLNAELHHSYGPTETSIAATEWTCERDSKHLIAPIGKPLGNIRVYILATRMQPAPMGIPGELYIGGICVGRGYLNHADLTAERFVPDSFSTDPGMRFYKTGDLARYLPDGNIEFCGRLDNQVKLRGYRIEPGEIEARLREHAALAEAVVMAREEAGEKRLVAYVVMKDGEESRACELREYMKERLPEYMVPWAYVKLERLPLTANGKADKRALPKPEAAGREMEESCQEPQTEVEEVMAEIWKQVLLVDRVGVEDNFFELGGDSILSIQVVSRFNQAGIKITPKQMFQHQTIAELARVAVKSVEINAEQLSVEGIVPLTPIQQSFFEREAPSRDHFNQSVMLRINQPIETDKMRLVVHRLVEHHDALRMRYEQGEKGWKQRNGAAEDNEIFSRIDLSDVGEEQYAKAIESNARQVQRSLSLSKGPLVRVVHYQSGDGTGRLLIVIHHLVVDGVSWRILLEDLQLGYEQVIKGEPIDFGKKTTSFKRWAEKLKEYANSEELRAELGYWGNLPEVEESRKGADKPGESYTTTSRRSINVRLSKEQTTSLLHEIGGVYHTQVNDLLLTGLARAVRKCGGKGRLVVEMEGHGREELFEGIDVSRTVGWFTSLYPVEIDIGREEKIGEQIKMVKEQLRKVPRNGIGYGLLRYLREGQEGQCLGNKRGEIRFNYLGQFDQVLVDEGRFSTARESKGGEVSDQIERDDLLEINGSVIGGRLEIAAGYTEETYTGESVERLAQCYREALEEIIAHCKSDDAGGYTPSDYPDSGLTQNILDQLIEEIGRVYD